ncbi:MAG TPA: hypothetical protein VK934_08295, partial [Fimbriimonas sp.]|nr:hypothetical protein [Fimbriimonas sp.]
RPPTGGISLVVTIKRWRVFAWPKLHWKSTEARPARVRKEREPLMESFEKMAGFYADTIIKAATK